jgi:hypothetical protein
LSALVPLAEDIGFASLALGVKRVEGLLQSLFRGLPGVDGVRRSDKQRIAEHFHVHGPSVPEFSESYNVAPQTFQPVIRLNRDRGEREIVLMCWGLIPFWILLVEFRRSS